MKIDIAQQEFIDKKLRSILVWLEEETGLEYTITSIYRPDDLGVHGTMPVRGVDLRMRDGVVGLRLADIINNVTTYNSKRPHLKCAIAHGSGSNFHLHLQTHPNTELDF